MKFRKYILGSLAVAVMAIGIISLFPRGIVMAGDPSSDKNSSQAKESAATESNQQSLLSSQPLPSPLTYSLERQNLIDQIKIKGQKGMVGYVALIGPQGQLVAYYTIKGKVSSLNSYLTTTSQIATDYHGADGISSVAIESPDLDGSYGNNPEGIFFFTTSGTYVEWSGSYLYSNQPLSYTQQPVLIENQKK